MPSHKRFTDEQVIEIHKWYVEDNFRTLKQAAKIIGTSDVTLISYFRRLELPIKPRGSKAGSKRGQWITLYCEVCKKPFELLESAYRARVKANGKPRFCSQKCTGIASSDPESWSKVTCDNCGVEFVKRTRFVRETNHCSKECSREGRKKLYAKWRDPDYIKTYMREYSVKNRGRLNSKKTEYLKTHKQTKLIAQKRYRQTHKAHISFLARARRNRINKGNFSQSEWDAIKAKYDYTCLCCKKQEPEIKLEIDHVIPLALGGKHDISNFQPLCRGCNAAKGTKCTDYR